MSDIVRLDGNPRMSMAVVYGGVAHLAGQVAIDHGGGPVEAQAQEVLARIDALLAKAGTDKRRLLTTTLYLADIATLPAVNAVWDAWIAPGEAPTRTTMQVILASPRYALEIAVSAAL